MRIDRAESRLQQGCREPEIDPADHPKVTAALLAVAYGDCVDKYGDLLDHDNGIVDHFGIEPVATPKDITNQ